MALTTIYPNGTSTVNVPATESIAISNYGGGIASIYYLVENANRPDAFQLQQTLENAGVVLGAFATGKTVKIEAGGSTVVFDVGASPDTGIGNADTLGGELPSYYTNASNISSGTLAEARLPSNTANLNGTQTFTGDKSFSGDVNCYNADLVHLGGNAQVGKDGVGNSFIQFWDDNSNVQRSLGWDDSNNYFFAEDSGGTNRRIWNAGDNASVGSGVSGSFTTADAKTVTVTNGIITAIV